MIRQETLEILRCPVCVQQEKGLLTFHQQSWLICQDCNRKYPVRNEIPVMLIEEGDKWIATPLEALPQPKA